MFNFNTFKFFNFVIYSGIELSLFDKSNTEFSLKKLSFSKKVSKFSTCDFKYFLTSPYINEFLITFKFYSTDSQASNFFIGFISIFKYSSLYNVNTPSGTFKNLLFCNSNLIKLSLQTIDSSLLKLRFNIYNWFGHPSNSYKLFLLMSNFLRCIKSTKKSF